MLLLSNIEAIITSFSSPISLSLFVHRTSYNFIHIKTLRGFSVTDPVAFNHKALTVHVCICIYLSVCLSVFV